MHHNHPAPNLDHIEPLQPQPFDFSGLEIASGQLADVVAALKTALAGSENSAIWSEACGLIREEEAQLLKPPSLKTGPDLGMVQVVNSKEEPLSAYLGRMRPDGIYPGDVKPSFSLARERKNASILAPLARLAHKLSLFKEARDSVEVMSVQQNVASNVGEVIH